MSDENYRIVSADEIEAKLRMAIIEQIPTARLRELAEAEREGRVVVMPCKIGDKIFTPCRVEEGFTKSYVDEQVVIRLEVIAWNNHEGQTILDTAKKIEVYTTQAEAERALAEKGEADDHK